MQADYLVQIVTASAGSELGLCFGLCCRSLTLFLLWRRALAIVGFAVGV